MNGDYDTYEAGEVADLFVYSGMTVILYRFDPGNKISNSDWEIQAIRGPSEYDVLVLDPKGHPPLFKDARQDYVSYVFIQSKTGEHRCEGWISSVHLAKRVGND